MKLLQNVHPEWLSALTSVLPKIEAIKLSLDNTNYEPPTEQVLRALEYPLSKIRVVIFGQDPYPKRGSATGLSFSVSPNLTILPMSLRNIFAELSDDIGGVTPRDGDLSRWAEQGVALVNRVLTIPTDGKKSHKGIGWEVVTDEIARVLGQRDVVAILWGKNAQELAHFFRDEWIVSSVHPSPLSARRGFFGSKPFSKANAILIRHGMTEIDW